ncbi:hypothetical protein [Nocardioides alkalitolerans]|uniref:hypothetical protein n=1 Tax=Nocardioides alkalitolerans TaxID=281714 RepID=UPI000415A6F7|nr:hypothetical protein [Nocardioides alkalitolerans]
MTRPPRMCPGPSCGAPITGDTVLCPPCFATVPAGLRGAVNRAHAAAQRARGKPWYRAALRTWHDARDRAIASIQPPKPPSTTNQKEQ